MTLTATSTKGYLVGLSHVQGIIKNGTSSPDDLLERFTGLLDIRGLCFIRKHGVEDFLGLHQSLNGLLP